jgi:hypothetical protein
VVGWSVLSEVQPRVGFYDVIASVTRVVQVTMRSLQKLPHCRSAHRRSGRAFYSQPIPVISNLALSDNSFHDHFSNGNGFRENTKELPARNRAFSS